MQQKHVPMLGHQINRCGFIIVKAICIKLFWIKVYYTTDAQVHCRKRLAVGLLLVRVLHNDI